jgi:subfamily B ATP-binding cassette protein HlyB/CyaB
MSRRHDGPGARRQSSRSQGAHRSEHRFAALASIPKPALLKLRNGEFVVLGDQNPEGLWRIVDPVTHADRHETPDALFNEIEPLAILIGKRIGGAGSDPRVFGFSWFLPSIWRYRKPQRSFLNFTYSMN